MRLITVLLATLIACIVASIGGYKIGFIRGQDNQLDHDIKVVKDAVAKQRKDSIEALSDSTFVILPNYLSADTMIVLPGMIHDSMAKPPCP